MFSQENEIDTQRWRECCCKKNTINISKQITFTNRQISFPGIG